MEETKDKEFGESGSPICEEKFFAYDIKKINPSVMARTKSEVDP